MATRPKKLQETLSKLHYQNPEKCAREVIAVTSTYKGLQYFMDTFDYSSYHFVMKNDQNVAVLVFNDGTQKELVKLEGTIPVLYKVFSNGVHKKLCKLDGTIPAIYKGTTYNFPVSIWLMETHPSNPPTCFVKPTSDMQIRVSNSVDHSGKIYLPYLHEWESNKSDLLTLVQILISKFTMEPPVFSRPSSTASVTTPYPLQPHMPIPGAAPGAATTTPYPPSTSAYPQNQLPYPQYPYPHQTPSYPLYPGQSYPSSYPSSYPQQNYNVATPYPAYPNSAIPPTTAAPPTNTTNSGTITEEHIRVSLLSALEDKMRRLMTEQSAHSQDEQNVLQQLHEELTRGKRTLDVILERLAQEQEELDKNLIMLKDKEAELMKSVERLSEQEPLDVDEAVTPTKPLYKQILNAYAEEAAIEDTIYYMGEALRRGVIDLEVFLKQVRSLSHKQFMQRALIQKCRLKAGLAG